MYIYMPLSNIIYIIDVICIHVYLIMSVLPRLSAPKLQYLQNKSYTCILHTTHTQVSDEHKRCLTMMMNNN